MPTIVVDTFIVAPRELCFDLAREVEAHLKTADWTHEQVVGGKISGLLELGDEITFEAVHLGYRQRLTARIVEMERPIRFVDEMVQGAFKSLRHTHEFEEQPEGTLMRDTLQWRSPLGLIGVIADKLFLERYMHRFVSRKQLNLKALVERSKTSQLGPNPPNPLNPF